MELQWDTAEGYFPTLKGSSPYLDVDRLVS